MTGSTLICGAPQSNFPLATEDTLYVGVNAQGVIEKRYRPEENNNNYLAALDVRTGTERWYREDTLLLAPDDKPVNVRRVADGTLPGSIKDDTT